MVETSLYYSKEDELLKRIEQYLETFNLDYTEERDEDASLPKLEIETGEDREVYVGLNDIKQRFPDLDPEKLPRKF